jgi:hypothetical protein
VKSLGDTLPDMLRERGRIRSGEKLGAELFIVGPLFTSEGGHGTEYSQYLPPNMRASFDAQFLRIPKTAEEAHKYVAELKTQGVEGIKIILEGGGSFKRMDVAILRAIADAAHEAKLPWSATPATRATWPTQWTPVSTALSTVPFAMRSPPKCSPK